MFLDGSKWSLPLPSSLASTPLFPSLIVNKHNIDLTHYLICREKIADETDFGLFSSKNQSIKLNGVVVSPQVFAELNVVKWMKLRTGLGYSIYFYKGQSNIPKSELNNLFISFGFIFGKLN